jgi:ABC-2 type transport system ATP-binding protein
MFWTNEEATKLSRDLEMESANQSMAEQRTLALDVRSLHKRYGDVIAVDGLDLQVQAGECFGLLGPNGAGKTTTIEICEGLLAADSGEVVILGHTWAADAKALRQKLGAQLQESQFADKLTVAETLALFRSFYTHGLSVDELIAQVRLEEKRNARVNELSGGQKQRLSVACALAGNPELIFLDEPTTGLDPQARRQLWELVEGLRDAGKTILLTTHYMDEAQRLCDRVAIVDHGHLIALGTPRELIQSLGVEQVVECSVAEGQSLSLVALEALPGVRRAKMEEDFHTLQVDAAHETIPALLALLEASGLTLTALRTHSPTLEDVFVALTGRHLREA